MLVNAPLFIASSVGHGINGLSADEFNQLVKSGGSEVVVSCEV
jgi:hypothetical protein